jgi:HEPN domain-containing protein
MDTQEKFQYWLSLANDALNSANTLFKGGDWLYMAFTCQQAIEKLVKSLYVFYKNDNVPRIHNI